jgi:hypothetical protein
MFVSLDVWLFNRVLFVKLLFDFAILDMCTKWKKITLSDTLNVIPKAEVNSTTSWVKTV